MEYWQVFKQLEVAKLLPQAFDLLEEEIKQRPHYDPNLPKRPDQLPRLVDPHDTRANLNTRVRSYLHANCAQCHVRAGGGNAAIDLEFATDLDKARLVGVRPQHQDFKIPDAQLVAPGHPERSVLYQRLALRGPGQMPPLASALVDREAVQMLHDWIKTLKPEGPKAKEKQ
jgi:mono/diheme cytochrome c family protein